MRYLTDRKRAVGKGSAHAGAEHHWFMIVSSVALAFMLPTWLIVFGRALGSGYDAALDTMSRPPLCYDGVPICVFCAQFFDGPAGQQAYRPVEDGDGMGLLAGHQQATGLFDPVYDIDSKSRS